MKKIEAKDLSIGDVIINSKGRFLVISIDEITDKSIIFKTNRIYPDLYNGRFYNRKKLKTILIIE